VWVDATDGTEVVHFLRAVLRLHGEENARFAGNAPPKRKGAAKPTPLADALAVEAERRSLDWLSLCATERAPRLWTHGLTALGAVLDMGHDGRRRRDPFASIAPYERERGWDADPLVRSYLDRLERPRPAYEDISRSDFPYRLTDEDRPSKLEMARYLSDLGAFERAAELAADLLADDPHHRLLNRLLGADLFVAGHRERGREILRHCIALTEIDPALEESERADEIATLHHLMGEYDAAISGYERALEADPLNAHAYQGLVLIHRVREETALAEHWLQAAQRRDLELPLLSGADDIEAAFEPAPAAAGPRIAADPRTRERRSRWWSFLKR
jgi:tetratricopeptide (TPR) repeat protein